MNNPHQIMDTEVQDIRQEVLGESKGVYLETGLPCPIKEEPEDKQILSNVYSHSQNITNLHQNLDTNLHNATHGVQIPIVKSENDDWCLEKSDGTPCFEKTHTNIYEVDSHNKSTNTGLGIINQETAVDKDRLDNLCSYSQGNDRIYIFENKDSHCDDKDNENNNIAGETRIIKQEIQEYFQDVKPSSCENTDFTIENKNSDVENNDIELEKSFMNIQAYDLKSENQQRFLDESDLKRENSDSLIDRYDDDISRSCTNSEESSSRSSFNSGEISWELADPVNTAVLPYMCNICKAEFKTRHLLSMHTCHGIPTSDKPFIFVKSDEEFTNSHALTTNQPSDGEDHLETGSLSNNGLKSVESLKQQMTSQGSKGPHQCYVCGKYFPTMSHLREHEDSHLHQCNVCDKTFQTFRLLSQHMLSHRTERPHQCNVCGKAFKTFTEERLHMISHKTERPHECTVCGKAFKTAAAVRLHNAIHSLGLPQPHRCNVCHKPFNSLESLGQHMIIHNTHCNVCDKTFRTPRNLKKHQATHIIQPPQECNECGKVFKTLGYLNLHVRTVHSLALYQCSVCDQTFKKKYNLSQHICKSNLQPRKRDIEPRQCCVCDKSFMSEICLKQHVRSVHNLESYPCSRCDKTFKRMYNLTQHICKSNDWPHQCSVCAKYFKTEHGWKIHTSRTKHVTERPHQCEVCDKSFWAWGCLRKHMNSHAQLGTEQQQHKHLCDVCGKAFKTLRSVKAHKLLHSPVASCSKDD